MGHGSSTRSVAFATRRIPPAAAAALAIGILGAAWAGVAGAQTGGLPAELGARVDQYIAAWDTHDAAALAQFFTADADMIMGTGSIATGRAAIQGQWGEYFAVQEPERTLSIEILSIRGITADVALLNVRTTTGGKTDLGELPARRARGTWVMVRRDGEWLVAAMRGMPTEQDRLIRSSGAGPVLPRRHLPAGRSRGGRD